MEKFIIIDGNSLANRAFYAMPFLSNREKKPSGAVFGFANLLVKLIVDHKPDFLAVAFDHARKTFRNEIFGDYKGTRKETPPDLRAQFPIIKEMLQVMGVKTFEFEGLEADDIIGTLAQRSGKSNVLVSGDRDLLQLVSDATNVWLTKKGITEVECYDKVFLREKYGLEPAGIVDLKALMGDASDNIPGVAGVGEKTALSLLEKYGALDGVYNNIDHISGKLKEKLSDNKENAYMSKCLATIKTDADFDFDIDECKVNFPFTQSVRDFFDTWDFRSLVNRKDIFAQGVRNSKISAEKIVIEKISQVKEFVKTVDKHFCYDLQKLEFSNGSETVYYLKKEIDLFSNVVEVSDVISEMKTIFENSEILKITNDAKSDMKFLRKYGIDLNNFFDIEIARYVLFAGLPKMEMLPVEDFLNAKNELSKKMDDDKVFSVYSEIEIPLVEVLVDMECEGFKIDEKGLALLSDKYQLELSDLTKRIYQFAGEEFNINSPKQVAHILFDKLGLTSYNNKKQSTSFAILDEMRWQHEIVDLIISYRKTSKLLNTYISVYQNICAESGPVIHTVFNQTLTSTGRLSSSEPNMQNIPTRDEEGKNLRKIFVSKYENGQIISADYNQIELRLLANLADEEDMISAYNQGVDIHTKTASEIFKVPVEEVSQSQRRDAKAVNFGIVYGISDYGLSQNIKTSRIKAKEYIDNYFIRYPKIKEYMEQNVEFAKEHGLVKSHFGRVRHIPEISASNTMVRKFGERVAMNMPLQGTASDVIKKAMIEVFDKLKTMQSHVILQVHDELIVDAPESEVENVKTLLKETMESVCGFKVPLKVSVSSGKTLYDCK